MSTSSCSLSKLLGTLKDYRRKQGQRHSLQIILLIVILGIMSGAKSERAICRFAENNSQDLIKLLKISRKQVPSRSVFQSVMQNINFTELANVFSKWAFKIVPLEKSDWVSLDGKAIGGTTTNCHNAAQNFISLVTVFVSKRKQAIAAGSINSKKESEILKVRKLIKMLDLEGLILTLDALHCQKKTVKAIKESGNDYVIGVKGNQRSLQRQLKKTLLVNR